MYQKLFTEEETETQSGYITDPESWREQTKACKFKLWILVLKPINCPNKLMKSSFFKFYHFIATSPSPCTLVHTCSVT